MSERQGPQTLVEMVTLKTTVYGRLTLETWRELLRTIHLLPAEELRRLTALLGPVGQIFPLGERADR